LTGFRCAPPHPPAALGQDRGTDRRDRMGPGAGSAAHGGGRLRRPLDQAGGTRGSAQRVESLRTDHTAQPRGLLVDPGSFAPADPGAPVARLGAWLHFLSSSSVIVGFPDETDSMIPRPIPRSAPMPIQIGAMRLRMPSCHSARPTPIIRNTYPTRYR